MCSHLRTNSPGLRRCSLLLVTLMILHSVGAGADMGVVLPHLLPPSPYAWAVADHRLPTRPIVPGPQNPRVGKERGSDDGSNRRWLCVGIGLMVGGGVLAGWSKQRADEAYDEYRRSAGENRQQRLWDRSRTYDRLAGAGLLTMEVGVVLATYTIFLRPRR